MACTLEQPEFTWQKLPKKKLELLQLEGGAERRRKDDEDESGAASDDSGDEEAGNEDDMDGSEAEDAGSDESPNRYSYAILGMVGIDEATVAVVEPNFFPAARRVERIKSNRIGMGATSKAQAKSETGIRTSRSARAA